jgi:hypothetical protein
MVDVQTLTVLREVVSSHINSIADAFFSLGGETSPDFVLGLTTLDEAFAFSTRSSCHQWTAYLRLHKLISSESGPQFKIFEHDLARPNNVYQLTSVTPASAADIFLRACCGCDASRIDPNDATTSNNFEAACELALSRTSRPINGNGKHQTSYLSLAQVAGSVSRSVFPRC